MNPEEIPPAIDKDDIDSIPIRVHPEEPPASRGESRASVNRDYLPWTSRLFGSDGPSFEVEGLTKDAFFRANFEAIRRIIGAVNDHFQLGEEVRLTEVEVLAVTNAEMGLKSGVIVDPKHDHQAGEFGLLPLSSIHRAVTGSDGPDPHGLYEPEINFEEFLLYLGGLKVFRPYIPVYHYPEIPGVPRRQAHTAAAVVHGYFYSPNYRPKNSKPANGNILSVIANDLDLGQFMTSTSFKASWAVPARMENLEEGMELAEELIASASAAPTIESTEDVPPGDLLERPVDEDESSRSLPLDEDDYIPEIFEDPAFALERRGGASWAYPDRESPCYGHLIQDGSDQVEAPSHFDVGPEEFDLLIRANDFDPRGKNEIIAFGIRGARLRGGEKVEDVSFFSLEDTRPDHRNFRCVIGFYFRDRGTFSAYTGSTVPWHGYMEKGLKNNLLPTGCYVYKTGVHRPKSNSRWVDPALRLSNGKLAEAGMATVLRTRRNLVFEHHDTWDRCTPMDNIHCAYSNSTFSSLGCQTVKGSMHSGLWADFQATLRELPKNVRVDYLLLTGAEFALAATALQSGRSLDDPALRRRIARLRTGSQGEGVMRLQGQLGVAGDGFFGSGTLKKLTEFQKSQGYQIDGIFTPDMDEQLAWNVFSPEPSPAAAPPSDAVTGTIPASPFPVSGGGERISFPEFSRRFVEGEIGDDELKDYFIQVPSDDRSLGPQLRLNPERVELPENVRGMENALLLANGLCNLRRRKKYKARKRENPDAIRVLAEGDSWFQYPVLLHDIIDHLMDDPGVAVRCFSAAGDVLQNMVEKPEFLDAIESENPQFFLLSGGGNDLVDEGLNHLLKGYDPGLSPNDYFNERYSRFLKRIEFLYGEVISLTHGEAPDLKIICHGYDYPVPNNQSWLGQPMASLGIENADLQYQIMKLLVDDINAVIDRAAGAADSGEVIYLDLRGEVPRTGWHDEFHPTSEFYAKLAARFLKLIR